jgi:nitronate monooxygenase
MVDWMKTRLTLQFDLTHPVIGAPMAFAGGGALAAAVTRAGGLGLIGGGYCDPDWIAAQLTLAGNTPVGVGFITWALAQNPGLLTTVLAQAPQAVFLSFGDPMPFAEEIQRAGVPLICQVQNLRDARRAVAAGAAIIVAQGAEAGGHGESRATMTLVPEIADMLTISAPDVLLVAAGGIADGRGLAASLMLGADGVLIGSALLASDEALLHPNAKAAILAADGDATLRTSVVDIARGKDWAARYSGRVLHNGFTDQWQGREDALRAAEGEAARWAAAALVGDLSVANVFVGEAAGLIRNSAPAAEIVNNMVTEAEALLNQHGKN